MNKHEAMGVGAISTGGLAALGHFADMIQPILADMSYMAAIIVGVWTIISKLRK
jgi:hypothetical protein